MANITLGKLLDRVEVFEDRLTAFYADVRDQSQDNGVRLLTYYLARHKRHHQQALCDFEKTDVAKLRRTKIPHDIPFLPEPELPLLKVSPREVTGRGLLECAMCYNAQLVRLYTNILMVPLNQDVSFLILRLIQIEARDSEMLKKMTALHYF